MCSNESLKVSLDNLERAVRESVTEQRKTRSDIDRLIAKFETWRETKCQAHSDKLLYHDKALARSDTKINDVSKDVNGVISRRAGLSVAAVVAIQLITLFAAFRR